MVPREVHQDRVVWTGETRDGASLVVVLFFFRDDDIIIIIIIIDFSSFTKRIFGLKVCLWESFDAEQHTSKRVLSLSLPNDGRTPRVVFFFRKGSANRFSLSLPFFAKHKQQIGTFVLAFGLEHYMHHKYHSHHHHDEAHQSEEERKNVGGHSPKEFSAETASLDEITKEMTRLRKRVGELRKEGKHV